MIFCDGNSRNLSNAIYCKHINYPLFERDQLDWATYWMYWLSIKEEMSPEGSRLESWISVVVVKLLIRPCFIWARISSVWSLLPCLWTGGSCTSGLYSGPGKASSSSFVMTTMFMAIKFTHSLLLLIETAGTANSATWRFSSAKLPVNIKNENHFKLFLPFVPRGSASFGNLATLNR